MPSFSDSKSLGDQAWLPRRRMLALSAATFGSAAIGSPVPSQDTVLPIRSMEVSILDWIPAALHPMSNARSFAGDLTDYLQRAFDEAPLGCTLTLPAGDYHASRSLKVKRQINILGSGARLIGSFDDFNSALLNIAVETSAFGMDVRQMTIEGLSILFSKGGGYALNIENAPPMESNLSMWIERCSFSVLDQSPGAAIRIGGIRTQLHTIIGCQIVNQIWLDKCADACRFLYNNMFGTKSAFKVDLTPGAFRTLISNNVITSRDGAMLLQSGSELDFIFNQVEQNKEKNQAPEASFIVIDTSGGRQVRRCNIINNNFGSGQNVDHAIVVKSGESEFGVQDTVIDGNTFGSTKSGQDIVLSDAAVGFSRIGSRNAVRGSRSGARMASGGRVSTNSLDASALLKVQDNGIGTYGVWQTAQRLELASDWIDADPTPLRFFKSEDGFVSFSGILTRRSNDSGDKIFTIPHAFQPDVDVVFVIPSDAGLVRLNLNSDGIARVNGDVGRGRILYFDGIRYMSQGHYGYSPGV